MKTTALTNNSVINKGFTLIELIVVIAILGVLSVVLLVVIDPLDKIDSANDTGVVAAVTQFGKANDQYAATNSNRYAPGTTMTTVLTELNAKGESKVTSYNPPSTAYSVNYITTPSCNNTTTDCSSYIFYVTGLQSKKNAAKPVYVYKDGIGCFKAAGIPTLATTCP